MRSTSLLPTHKGMQNNGIVILLLYLHSTIAEATSSVPLHFAVPSCVASHVAVGHLMPLALSLISRRSSPWCTRKEGCPHEMTSRLISDNKISGLLKSQKNGGKRELRDTLQNTSGWCWNWYIFYVVYCCFIILLWTLCHGVQGQPRDTRPLVSGGLNRNAPSVVASFGSFDLETFTVETS